MEELKEIIGEIEADFEKCEKKNWLDYKTLKRLDKAIVVMKVGYKIGKRGLNRDKKFGRAANADDPAITEADQQNLREIAEGMLGQNDFGLDGEPS